MNLTYKRVTLEDLDILIATRIEVLRAANKLSDDTDMSKVEKESYNYYQKALSDGSHIAYLVFDGSRFVGAGGVSFFQVMPTYHFFDQKIQHVISDSLPSVLRICIHIHNVRLISARIVKSKGITSISLEATDMGRPLYEKYGFVKMNDEMELP